MISNKSGKSSPNSLFNIFHLNIQCLKNKVIDLNVFLIDSNIDILCINEHWLVEDEVEYITLEGYYLASNFSRKTNIHGGVAIFCKNIYNCSTITQINKLSVELHCELTGVVCDKFIIITTYRSPSLGDFDIFLQTLANVLNFISQKNKNVIFTGDFNVHFNNPDKHVHAIINIFSSFGFIACNTSPTRLENCLDNVFINFSFDNCKLHILDPKLSDHAGINLSVNNCRPPQLSKKISYRPISDIGLFHMNSYLQQIDWRFIDDPSFDIDTKSNSFLDTIIFALDKYFPVKSKILNNNKINLNWYTNDLRQMRESLHLLLDVYKKSPSNDLKELIKHKKRTYRNELIRAKKTANDNYIHQNKNQQKAMWHLININKSSSVNQSDMISPDDFNNYFGNIAENLINSLPSTNDNLEIDFINSVGTNSDKEFTFSEVTYIQVLDIIDNLKKTKSNDAYDINIKILNCIKYIILIPLTNLINQCIRNNVFPKFLKCSKVLPLFKSNCMDNPANYRPISIVPIFAKIFEVVLKIQITTYFENSNLFTSCQYGFRAKLSTTGAINSLINLVNKGFEANEFVHVQFLDLSKAFDCVPHDNLLSKLKCYNFSASSQKLIMSYLTDRTQFVYFNNANSRLTDIKFGVPQGSVLGPILFLIYVNDLPNSTPSANFTLFADDTSLTHSHSDFNMLLTEAQNSLLSAQNWFTNNKLVLNKDKTETMVFSLRQHSELDNSHSVKFLGVLLDSKLTWEEHTVSVCKNISRKIFLLRNLRNCLSHSTLKIAYHALIQSSLSYALLVWGHSAHASTVFSMQRKAVRVIAGLQYRDDCRAAFKNFNILTLPCAYIFQCLMHIKVNIDKYITNESLHSYSTRNKDKIHPDYLRLSRTRNGTSYYATKFFNALPSVVQVLERERFKSVIKRLLIDHAFYDFEEFLSTDFSKLTL